MNTNRRPRVREQEQIGLKEQQYHHDTGEGNEGYHITQANRRKRTEHSKEVTQRKKAGPYGILWGRSTGATPFNRWDTNRCG